MLSSMARIVSLAVLALLIVFLGITFYRVVAPFLLPLFLAGVLAILCQPLFRWFVRKTNGRVRWGAALTTLAVLVMVLVPLIVGTVIAAVQLTSLGRDFLESGKFNEAMQTIRAELQIDRLSDWAETIIGRELSERELEQLQADIRRNARAGLEELAARTFGFAGHALGFLGTIVAGIVGLVMFIIALYYFLADGPALIAGAERLIPVQAEYQRTLLDQFNKVVRAVVVATFAAALVQGVLTASALWIAGFHHFFLFLLLVSLAALVPLAGAWLVWGPCAAWLAYQNHWGAAIGLTLFGTVVVGTADNVVRTYVLHTDAKLHPLLAFISVLGGLHAMGLWGVFVGPIVASFLHALVQIFNTELNEFSMAKQAERAALPAAFPAATEGREQRGPSGARPAVTPPSSAAPMEQPATVEPSLERATASAPFEKKKRRRRRRSRGRGTAAKRE
ncbi:MAG: AI-2E family transporter [Planctomycetaceae bacterium]